MRITLLTIIALTLAFISFGQSPEGFKYQAVIRDAGNLILTDQAVGMQLSIQQGSIGGTSVYTETFSITTNAYGLVNLEIGTGISTDDFTMIDWANGPYFMETAVDITGGMTYEVMGTSQLMSVPYALYAKTSGNGEGPQGPAGVDGVDGAPGPQGLQGPAGENGINGTNGPAGADGVDGVDGVQGPIGPSGADGTNGTNGSDGNDGAQGAQGDMGATGADGAQGIQGETGAAGTNGTQPTYTLNTLYPELGGYVIAVRDGGKHGLVVAMQDQGTSNWYEANDLLSDANNHDVNGAKFMDWRLPTKRELNLMYGVYNGSNGANLNNYYYWSSTEVDNVYVWSQSFYNGGQDVSGKYNSNYVRAVRAF
jgi:hypothetical protein